MLVGIVSDTHIPRRARSLPPQLLKGFWAVDMILHAGDILSPETLEELARVAPVTAVAGNGDPPELHARLGETKRIVLGAHTVGLCHGHAGQGSTTPDRALSNFPDADCVVFGHSHQPLIATVGGVLLVNPGSPTDRRRAPDFTFALMRVGDTLQVEMRHFS